MAFFGTSSHKGSGFWNLKFVASSSLLKKATARGDNNNIMEPAGSIILFIYFYINFIYSPFYYLSLIFPFAGNKNKARKNI
jgi:hypothetical protein